MSADPATGAMENYGFQKIVVAVGVFLMAVKFIAYAMTSSVAILTDALESIVNVVAGFIGLFALYMSSRPPDRDHPYGHGRIETISAAIEGTLIFVAGMLIIREAVMNFLHPRPLTDLDFGLLLIAFAAVANYVTGKAAIRTARRNGSPALEASGKHLCTDTYSSIGIIAGLSVVYFGAMAGLDIWWMDPLLAVIFGALILSTGVRVVKNSFDNIMDRADEELLRRVVGCLNRNRGEGWIDVHNLRIVKYGSTLHMDCHVTVPFSMTVEEEHRERICIISAI